MATGLSEEFRPAALVRVAALSDGLLALIDEWRTLSLDIGVYSWVLYSDKLTTTLAKTTTGRELFGAVEAIGLASANFQVDAADAPAHC